MVTQAVSFTARADDLFDLLKPSNKLLTCSTGVLKDDSILKIGMPKRHGDFLVINLRPDWNPTYVVYPKPRWPLKLASREFRTMTSVAMKVRDIAGISYTTGPAFYGTGTYEIIVGSGFDTPSPNIDGWCEVYHERQEPLRSVEEPDSQPNRWDVTWNKMKCSPSRLTEKSVLKIELPFPHGNYLSVVYENNYADVEYLSYPASAPGWPLLDSGNFERMRSVSLRVTDVKVRKQEGFKRVLMKPGQYLFRVGSHFETDGPSYLGWCRVTYRPKRRG